MKRVSDPRPRSADAGWSGQVRVIRRLLHDKTHDTCGSWTVMVQPRTGEKADYSLLQYVYSH